MTQEPEEACPQFYMLIVFIKHILHLKRHHLNPIFTINNYYRKHFKREKNKYFHCECLAWGNTRVRLERIVAKIPLSSHMNGHKAFFFHTYTELPSKLQWVENGMLRQMQQFRTHLSRRVS